VASLAFHTACNRIQRFAGLDAYQRSKVLPSLTGLELFFLYQVSYTFYSELLRRMKYGATAQGSSFFAKTHRRLSLKRKAIIMGFASWLSRSVYSLFLRAFFTLLSKNLLKTGKNMSNDLLLQQLMQKIDGISASVKGVESRLGTLEAGQADLSNSMSRMERDMGERIGRLERTVGAIESFPVPYGRPKSYYSATSMHSVSGAVRRRQSYAG
jgi:hypothetical protein